MFCETRWQNLTLLDYAFLSQMAYLEKGQDDAEFAKELTAYFPDKNWIDLSVPDDYTKDAVKFHDLFDAISGVSILAVRGTAGMRDVIQDIDIWMSVTLFQLASNFGPSFLQPSTKDIIYWATFMKRSLKSPNARFYFERLNDYVKAIRPHRSDVILTGHSLGGGLAKIVGARNRIRAVTFSSPGLMYTSKSVDVKEEDVHETATTLYPDLDVVPRTDKQIGSVLPIDCDQNVLACHGISRSICELLRTCGDPKGRRVDKGVCPPDYYA